jgi:dGTPase
VSERIMKAIKELRDFLFETVYFSPAAREELIKTEKILKDLYAYTLEHPLGYVKEYPAGDLLEKRVVDVIAGMTDSYALALYEKVFFPRSWPIV